MSNAFRAPLKKRNEGTAFARPVADKVVNSERLAFKLETVAEGLETPWSVAFLPDGRMLVTEKAGRLRVVEKGRLLPKPIEGTFSIGERGHKEDAQELSRPNGKVHRIHEDGSIPKDNPFAGREGAIASIWSYGNRNPQGLTRHPVTGELWEAEHGPRGGDELNRIEPGHNYGWPVITYGMNYDGTPMTDRTAQEGMEQPVLHWTPSIAVSAIDFYTGSRFPQWKNDLLVGALAQQELRRLRIEDGKVVHQEVLFKDIGRVRDVVSGPDGAIYIAFNEPDRIARLVPASPVEPASGKTRDTKP
ncbi:PQQ-dependent sugar dehydrogenase [Archangium violaceum]|uniref:PQQ-dependent sugar dehydrogenase n=1 Tax=Archangium violaceum TaxID=83451 RepID=UPI002B324C09|nr:PQQ-dependent sugar dehydrogenase [Archangium violaceum]